MGTPDSIYKGTGMSRATSGRLSFWAMGMALALVLRFESQHLFDVLRPNSVKPIPKTGNQWIDTVNSVVAQADANLERAFDPTIVPLVDLKGLQAEDPSQLELIYKASKTSGAFLVRGHGFKASFLQAMHEHTLDFFNLDEEEKVIENDPAYPTRVYRPNMATSVAEIMHRNGSMDRRELLILGDGDKNGPFPKGMSEVLKSTLNEYMEKMTHFDQIMQRAWAIAFGRENPNSHNQPIIDQDLFVNGVRKHRPSLAISHYPEFDLEDDEEEEECKGNSEEHQKEKKDPLKRLDAHSDIGFATYLINDMPGFQVEYGGHWYNVPFARLDGEKEPVIIVLVGELLARWTNAHFRACVHRVKVVSETQNGKFSTKVPRRLALGVFSAQDTAESDQSKIVPVVLPGKVARYEPFSVHSFQQTILQTFTQVE